MAKDTKGRIPAAAPDPVFSKQGGEREKITG